MSSPRGNRNRARVRARNWVAVRNNPSGQPDDWGRLELADWVQFAVWQGERGESGTPHLQMYIQCRRAVDLSTLQKWIPGAHFEVARGDVDANVTYCTKEDTRISGPWRFGEPKHQGSRTDLQEIADQLNTGKTIRDVAVAYPAQYIRYHRGIRAYQQILGCPPRPGLRVIIYWGASGVGKTSRAKREFPNATDIPETKEGWMGDYTDATEILFDDFEGVFPLRLLLKIVSHHAHVFPSKGGFVSCRASTIIFTSNEDPKTWYTDRNGGYHPAWLRRLSEPWTTIEHMVINEALRDIEQWNEE